MQSYKIDELQACLKDTVNFRRTRPTSGRMRSSMKGKTSGRRMWMKSHFEQAKAMANIGTNELYPTHSSFALVEEAVMLWGKMPH